MTTPGLLTLTACSETLNGVVNTSASAYQYIGKTIPHQVLILRGYNVITNPQNLPSLPNGATIYIDLPFLGGNCLTDALSYQNRLPIPIDVSEFGIAVGTTTTTSTKHTTFRDEMTMPMQLINDIPQNFTMKVYNRDGTPVSTSWVLYVQLQFSYGSASVAGF